MARDFGQGIFTVQALNTISSMKNKPLVEQKKFAQDIIDASSAVESNKIKATEMVRSAGTHAKLLIGASNFSLSHQGLKVIR